MGNIPKALQRYVGFEGIDLDYCDKIKDLMDKAQAWALDIEEIYNKAEIHSINTSKEDSLEVGVFSNNSKVTVFEFLESAELAYLGWGNSVQKANQLYNKHLSEEIKSYLIDISDDYGMMKNWLICNYGGPSRIVGDIISNLVARRRPALNNRKEKFSFYSAIIGALQRLEKLSRTTHINRDELESCLLSRNTLSTLVKLLPIAEYDLWVREMTVAGLDFRNPEGLDTFACFKKICIIERNTNEYHGENSSTANSQVLNNKRMVNSSHQVKDQNKEVLDQEQGMLAVKTTNPTLWNLSAKLKFPCPLIDHNHEIRKCKEFFDLSPRDRWEKLEKNRMGFSCLEPKRVYKLKICMNHINVPKVSKSLALFSFFCCRRKEHGDTRASPSEIKDALESYIGKLANGIVEANILFAVNFMFKGNSTIEERRNLEESGHAVKMFPQTPVIDSET